MRSDSKYRLGYCDESTILKYSPYLIVDYRRPSNVSLSAVSSLDSRSSASSSFDDDFVPTEITYISLSSACQVVITALKCERGEFFVHISLLGDAPFSYPNFINFNEYSLQINILFLAKWLLKICLFLIFRGLKAQPYPWNQLIFG